MEGDVEQVKRDPADFGGLQFRILTDDELKWRYCSARGCGYPAAIQMPQPRFPDEQRVWRTLCSQHFIQVVFVIDAFLGDPSPSSEANRLAEAIGYVGDPLRHWKDTPATVFNPAFARCARCGGGFTGETIGMYSGSRYIHTCGVTSREAGRG